MTLNLHLVETPPETFQQWGDRIGLTVSAVSIPARPDVAADSWNAEADHFLVTVSRKDGQLVWRGNYSTGSAHALTWARKSSTKKGYLLSMALRELKTLPRGEFNRSLYAEEQRKVVREAYQRAAPIGLDRILESLHCDMSGVDQPFEDWAGDLGMDSDSRKALRIYEDCQAVRAAFVSSLSRADFESFLACEES